jgi:phosphatidylethanolamine-binding protein (PEBP) family uncharacterized protein
VRSRSAHGHRLLALGRGEHSRQRTELAAGAGDESGSALPEGAFQLPNDARMACYVGAGPPEGHGRHRYIFAVLALEAERIEIDKGATPALLMFNLFNGTLGRAFLEGWYER